MRIKVALHVEREIAISLNHQSFLTAAVYDFLDRSNADYARFLHDDGYAAGGGAADRRRYKLFCFSTIRSRRRRIVGDRLTLGEGQADWIVASPLEKFLTEFAAGLLSSGVLRVGRDCFAIANVVTLPTPVFYEEMAFTCLTPFVASVAVEGVRHAYYLRPGDERFSACVRANLLRKYFALHGVVPEDDCFELLFDDDYLRRHKSVKMIEYKGGQIIGAFCPFTLRGAARLIELAYNAGLGEKNAAGFGMMEVQTKNKP